MFESILEKRAIEHGVEFRRLTEYHCQLKALHCVNVYLGTGSFYINGMASKEKIKSKDSYMFLIRIALGTENFKYTKEKVKRVKLPRTKKQILWQKNPVCYVCAELMMTWQEATWEHKIPLDKGGTNRSDNLALSHEKCNQERGNNIGVLK